LVDFGIAKAASSSTHTQTGVLKGKLAYLSPEQAWGKPIDHRSDLFALGIVLHEMLTGQRLFKAENEFTTLERVRTADVTPPSAVKKGLPPELDGIVLKSLAKNPDDRYPNGQAFEDALQEYLRRLSAPPGARDLSEYLRTLFDKDIETDTAAFHHVTTVTKTTATPTTKQPGPVEPTRAAPKPPSAPIQAPTPRRTGRHAAIGLGVAALVALTAVGAWSLRQPATIDPPTAPVADITPPDEPIMGQPVTESITAAPSIADPAVAVTSDEPSMDSLSPQPSRPENRTTEDVAPESAKRPKRAPDVVRVKTSPRVAAPTAREANVTTPNPTRAVAGAPTALEPITNRPAVAAPKPVVQAKPAPITQPVPVRPAPAAPLPPQPVHEDAPLPLLP
jgi:serine/threonine protein kinase